jgi:predicted lipid-binding transport protein (Tim44 family)
MSAKKKAPAAPATAPKVVASVSSAPAPKVAAAPSASKASVKAPAAGLNKGVMANEKLPFGRQNYFIMLASIGVILVGYLLLRSDEFVDANQFSVPLYIAPWVLMLGYMGVIVGIMYRSRKPQTAE